jgi:hypothetical protein
MCGKVEHDVRPERQELAFEPFPVPDVEVDEAGTGG